MYIKLLQELAESVKDGFNRPKCMKDNEFIHPDTQCPKKPKGRKKKQAVSAAGDPKQKPEPKKCSRPRKSDYMDQPQQHAASSRPSAAACGFSTLGMTDDQAHAKLAEVEAALPAETVGKAVPKKRKGKAAEEIEATSSKPSKSAKCSKSADEAADACKQPAKRKGADADTAETTSRKKRKARKTNTNPDTAEHAEDAETTHGVPAVPTMPEAPHQDEDDQGGNGQDGNGQDGEDDDDAGDEATQIAAAKKQKASRKSSAYHKAAAQAKREGKSREEQKAAGKAVTWFTLYIYIVHVACMHYQY